MVHVTLALLLNSKIIYYQTETDESRLMLPKTGGGLALVGSLVAKALLQKLLGYNSYVGQAVHALTHASDDIPLVVNQFPQVVHSAR